MLFRTDQGAPKFAHAGAIVADCLAELRYPPQISGVECADQFRIVDNPGAFSGWWRDSPHDTRFTHRALNTLCDMASPFREVVIEGPTQTSKSEIGNNWQLHTILFNQRDMMFVMPDRTSIDQYVKTQWDKMIDLIPEVKARLIDGAHSNTINLKQFKGCSFFFQWPSGPTFRFKPISLGRIDELDDIPQDIGAGAGGKDGQGDPLSLILGRGASFSAYGGSKVYVNSTPRLGQKRGIAALRVAGTDERWWVDCLACGDPFELDTESCLTFDRTGSAADAAASAEVVCMHCGGAHRQSDKRALMDSGRWIGRGETAVRRDEDPAGKIGELLPNRRLSQRWDGLMGFRRWADMAEQWRTAELAFENEQDEGPLKTYFQTVIGKNYTPRSTGEPPVAEDELQRRARLSAHRFGFVPREAMCLVFAVDQAVNRFEVGAWAFAPGYRAWLVDRFAIVNCGDEPLKPFTRPEHFSVLHPRVLAKRYPVAGAPHLFVKPLCTVVDTGGMDSATDNAFAWWHSMVAGDVGSGRAPVPPSALMLYKGGNKATGKLLPPPTIDAKRQLPGAPPCELWVPNANRIKDMADTGLRRGDGGSGSIAFPGDIDGDLQLLAAPYIAEFTAEEKIDGAWTRPKDTKNETLDLYVMARSALIRFGGHDHSLSWVPAWARPPRLRPLSRPEAAMAESAAHAEVMKENQTPMAEIPKVNPMQAFSASVSSSCRPRPKVRVVRAR
jgi:phage terminase large subunit GpA-like protein